MAAAALTFIIVKVHVFPRLELVRAEPLLLVSLERQPQVMWYDGYRSQ